MHLLFQKWCQEIITGTNAADQWKGPFLVRDSPLLLLLSQHKIRARWLPFPIPFTGIIISSFISSPSQHLFLNDELCGRRHFYYKSPIILHIFSSQKNRSPQVFPSFFSKTSHPLFLFFPSSSICILSVWLVSPSLNDFLVPIPLLLLPVCREGMRESERPPNRLQLIPKSSSFLTYRTFVLLKAHLP